jgi:hypothetical protein
MAEQKTKDKDESKNTIEYALESDEVVKIYANGFANFLNNADVGLVLQVNGRPKAVVNMSYTLAKTLYKKLGSMIQQFEKESDHEIMDTDFISKTLTEKN